MPIIGLGTDIVEISRFDKSTERNDRLAKRVLSETEYVIYRGHKMPERYLAKRFAAKEAAVKAIGIGIGNGISWQQIEVVNLDSGQPILQFNGHFSDICQQKGVTSSHVSISDEENYAVASVILER